MVLPSISYNKHSKFKLYIDGLANHRKGQTVLAIVIVIAHDLYKGFDDFRANIRIYIDIHDPIRSKKIKYIYMPIFHRSTCNT